MYRKNKIDKRYMAVNESQEGESIETKVRRITVNKEPIRDNATLLYFERKDGVRAETNIRTDRFDIAVEAMDKVSGTLRAKRGGLTEKKGSESKGGEAEGGQPVSGTNDGNIN